MKDLQKIAQMVGNTYLYKKENYTIKGFIPEEQKIRLKTDHRDIVLLTDDLPHCLELFLEVEQENTALQVAQQSQAQSQITNNLSELNDIMMQAIRTVQHDKDYVAQATAVTKGVTSITNLIKAQLEIVKITNGK